MRIGFIGLGVMGLPMAGHLAKAGNEVTVFDRDPGRAEMARLDHGARVAQSAAETARDADVVVTMLPDGQVVRAVVDSELVHTMKAGAILLDTSSAEPWLTRECGALLTGREIAMVDAPVSGAEAGAIAGELIFMVGGPDEAVERVKPLLEAMGSKHFHLGPLGSGHAMKSLNNLVTAVTFMATGEALLVGKRAGLDPDRMIDVLNLSTGGSWVGRTHFQQRIFNRAFDDPFKLGLMVKDIGIAEQVATDAGVTLDLSSKAAELWREIERDEGTASSVSRLIAGMEARSGVTLTPGASEDATAN